MTVVSLPWWVQVSALAGGLATAISATVALISGIYPIHLPASRDWLVEQCVSGRFVPAQSAGSLFLFRSQLPLGAFRHGGHGRSLCSEQRAGSLDMMGRVTPASRNH